MWRSHFTITSSHLPDRGLYMRFDWVQVRIDVKLLLTWLNYGSGFQQSSSGDVRHHFPFTFAEEHHNITVDWMLLDDVMSHTHIARSSSVKKCQAASSPPYADCQSSHNLWGNLSQTFVDTNRFHLLACTVLDSLTERTLHFYAVSIYCRLRATTSGKHILDIERTRDPDIWRRSLWWTWTHILFSSLVV